MAELVPTLLAVLVVVMFALALYAMAADRLTVAGLFFLSASVTIYLREQRFRGDDQDA